ncbi:MAG: porin family protein [Muribaculaceae bacterium]
MKKIFMLIVAALLCASPMSAQRQGQSQTRRTGENRRSGNVVLAKKKHAFYLGVKGGLDLTTMTQPDECDLYDGMGMGFSGGLVGRVRFNPATPTSAAGTGLLGAGLELKYKQNKVKTIGTDESGKANADFSVNYFEVPVYLQVFPFYKTDNMNTFYIEVGPDFAGVMGRSPKSLTVGKTSGDFSQVTYNLDTDGSQLKGMDIRVMAGLGYDFAIKNSNHETTSLIGINARYYLGTSKLAGNFNSKMSTMEVSLSWMFSIGKL